MTNRDRWRGLRQFQWTCAFVVCVAILVPVGCLGTAAASTRVTIAMPDDIKGYHPYWHAITKDRGIRANIYDSLVMRDTDGSIIPGLAESWKVPDPTTWEFRLRKGVKFHNGEPFNAATVKFALDVARSHKMSRERTFLDPIEEVRVMDDLTVRLKMKRPAPDFLHDLQYMLIMPKALVEEKGLDFLIQHPVGTGAFKFVEWKKDEHSRFAANPDWWRGRPKIDEVVYRPIPEGSTRVAALLTGEVDIIENPPPEDLNRIAKSGKTRVLSAAGPRLMWLGYDCTNKVGGKPGKGSSGLPEGERNPFLDVRVREAVAHAIDLDLIAKQVLNGLTKPAAQMLPPGFTDPRARPRPHDVEKARALLRAAGFPNGFRVRLDTTSGYRLKDEEVAVAIADQLGKVGIKAEVNALKSAVLIPMLQEYRTSLYIFSDMIFDLGGYQKILMTVNPASQLGRNNYGQCSDKKLDDFLRQAMTNMDEAKRPQIAGQTSQRFWEVLPFIPLYREPFIIGISNRVEMPVRMDFQIRAYDIAIR